MAEGIPIILILQELANRRKKSRLKAFILSVERVPEELLQLPNTLKVIFNKNNFCLLYNQIKFYLGTTRVYII